MRSALDIKLSSCGRKVKVFERPATCDIDFCRSTLGARTDNDQSVYALALENSFGRTCALPHQQASNSCVEARRPSPAFQTCTASRLALTSMRLNLQRFTVPEDSAGPKIVYRLAVQGLSPVGSRTIACQLVLGAYLSTMLRADSLNCMLTL